MEPGTIHVEWRAPVTVRIGYGTAELVRGPAEACDYLARRWPMLEGFYHDLAERKCRVAADRRAAVEESRNLFISAAIEASVLAWEE